jgi:hypothetical protein
MNEVLEKIREKSINKTYGCNVTDAKELWWSIVPDESKVRIVSLLDKGFINLAMVTIMNAFDSDSE